MKEKMLSQRAVVAFLLSFALSAFASAAEKAAPTIAPKANDVLNHVSDFYKHLNAYTVNADFKMSVTMPGSRKEAWANYDVAVEQPNKASFVIKEGIGASVVSNGKDLLTYIPALQKYTKVPAPASLNALASSPDLTLINNSVGDLFMLDSLLKADPRAALLANTTAVKYIGEEEVNGVKAHHLLFERSDFSRDVWVQDGPEPWLLKISPDVSKVLAEAAKNAPNMKPAKMEMAVNFKNWKQEKSLPGQTFALNIPSQAKEVASFFEKEAPSSLVGKAAPNVPLNLLGGGKLNLPDMKGDVVVLDFWATWCAPCLNALPVTSEVAQAYKEKGVHYFSIDQEETPEQIEKFMKQHNWSFPVALDETGKLSTAYGIEGIPFTVVIDKDGIVRNVHVGMAPNLKAELSREIEGLLAGQPVPASTTPSAR